MNELPRGLKIATLWLVLGTAVFLGVQAMQSHEQRTRFVVQGSHIEIRRGGDGHYHWPATVNGRAVDFLVDTGATGSALPQALARELALPVLGAMSSSTAGGVVQGQWVQADLALQGGVRVDRLRLAALPALATPLLGMDVLARLQWQQSDGVLRIDLQARQP